MNKRQKKKLYKNSLIKIKKLHPRKDDVICLIPNLDEISIEMIKEFLNVYTKEKIFGETPIIIVPCDIGTMNKEVVEILYEEVLSTVRKGGE